MSTDTERFPSLKRLARTPVNGCAHCGQLQRGHAQRYVPGHGWHTWVSPDSLTRKVRILTRRRYAEFHPTHKSVYSK